MFLHVQAFTPVIFYAQCSFRECTIMVHHNFLSFVDLNNVCALLVPLSAIYLHKLLTPCFPLAFNRDCECKILQSPFPHQVSKNFHLSYLDFKCLFWFNIPQNFLIARMLRGSSDQPPGLLTGCSFFQTNAGSLKITLPPEP